MDRLHKLVAAAIAADRVYFTVHAVNRMQERGVEKWQVVEGFNDAELITSYPNADPNPKLVLRQSLASGETVVVVWSYVNSLRSAKLVTVYFSK